MKINNFSISRFRSFTENVTLDFSAPIILVGPNNGGKSTLCDAIEIFFAELGSVLRHDGTYSIRRRQMRNRYSLERDYPKSLQSTKGRKWPTEFAAEFSLTVEESAKFLEDVKLDLKNGKLKLKVSYSYEKERLAIESSKLSREQIQYIIQFISNNYRTICVPAVRDGEMLNKLLHDLVNQTLKEKLSTSRKLSKIEQSLKKIVEPKIKELTKELGEQIKVFLDNVKDVNLNWELNLTNSIRIKDILIDDGSKTSIDLKGDGTKNLLLLGHITDLIQNKKNSKTSGKLIIIEEPESHLNSSYLYSLKEKLNNISSENQVLITTHSPVFVDLHGRSHIYTANGGIVKRCESRRDIADILGVRLGENLSSNEILILTEGAEDETSLRRLLKTNSVGAKAISRTDFLSSYGAGNIHYLYQANKNFYKKVIAIVDYDKAGLEAVKNLKKFGMPDSNIFTVPLKIGFKEHEIEDLFEVSWIIELLQLSYGRTLNLDSAIELKSKFKAKFGIWIVPYLKSQSVPVEEKEAVKFVLWDQINQAPELKLSDDGKIFLESIGSCLA